MASELIGHQTIADFFESALARQALAHTYCFVGPEQIGKKTMAYALAGKLLNVSVEKLNTHPDFIMVERPLDEKTGFFKRDISVEQARTLRHTLAQRTWSGGYRVVVIDEATAMSTEAANALLKTLEEPPGKTIIFLIADHVNRLLPTIRSRAEIVYFSLVPEQAIVMGLTARGVLPEAASEAVRLSGGKVGLAVRLAGDAEERAWYAAEGARFRALLGAPFYKQLALIDELFDEKKATTSVRDRLLGTVRIWLGEARREWLKGISAPTSRDLYPSILRLYEAQELLRRNVNPRLIFENILLPLG